MHADTSTLSSRFYCKQLFGHGLIIYIDGVCVNSRHPGRCLEGLRLVVPDDADVGINDDGNEEARTGGSAGKSRCCRCCRCCAHISMQSEVVHDMKNIPTRGCRGLARGCPHCQYFVSRPLAAVWRVFDFLPEDVFVPRCTSRTVWNTAFL